MASQHHIPTRTLEQVAQEFYDALSHAQLLMPTEDFAKLHVLDAMTDLEALLGHRSDEDRDKDIRDFINEHPNLFRSID